MVASAAQTLPCRCSQVNGTTDIETLSEQREEGKLSHGKTSVFTRTAHEEDVQLGRQRLEIAQRIFHTTQNICTKRALYHVLQGEIVLAPMSNQFLVWVIYCAAIIRREQVDWSPRVLAQRSLACGNKTPSRLVPPWLFDVKWHVP